MRYFIFPLLHGNFCSKYSSALALPPHFLFPIENLYRKVELTSAFSLPLKFSIKIWPNYSRIFLSLALASPHFHFLSEILIKTWPNYSRVLVSPALVSPHLYFLLKISIKIPPNYFYPGIFLGVAGKTRPFFHGNFPSGFLYPAPHFSRVFQNSKISKFQKKKKILKF